MFTWKKLGQIFNPQEAVQRPWMREFAQAPCAVLFDDYIRVYFSCRPSPDAKGFYISRSAFVDLKRDDLFKVVRVAENPILSLGNPGMFDEFGTYPVSVIRHGDEMWAYYGGWTRCESVPFNVAIGCAISRDGGITFSRIGNGPILSFTLNEPFVLSGPKIRRFNGLWYLWYIAGRKWIVADGRPEPIYKIRMAVSKDGLMWSKINKDLIESRIEEDEAQASPDVIFWNGKYHMFFCYRKSKNYRGKAGGYRIGYAYSYDLENWTRDDTKAGIDVSDTGWDSEMISYPHVFELDGKIYLFYLGNQVGRYGFGAAVLEGTMD